MKAWSAIFNLIGVLAIIILGASYVNIHRALEMDFDKARYDYAVEQATEAMFRMTLNSEDIDLDYQDMGYVSIDSSQALEIFDRVMCANYDLAPTDVNFDAINDSILSCVIAGFNGYYILESSEADFVINGDSKDGYEPKFSIKYPYFQTSGSLVYAIDSYKHSYISVAKVTDSEVQAGITAGKSMHKVYEDSYATKNPVYYTSGDELPSGIDPESIAAGINNQIRNNMMLESSISNNISTRDLVGFKVFFPEITTVSGVNPLSVPAIILIMDGAEYAGTAGMVSVGVSGYKIVKRVNVVAFTDTSTNISYYCYEGQLDFSEKAEGTGGLKIGDRYGTFVIENYYRTITDACKEKSPTTGKYYVPYHDIMARKITRK